MHASHHDANDAKSKSERWRKWKNGKKQQKWDRVGWTVGLVEERVEKGEKRDKGKVGWGFDGRMFLGNRGWKHLKTREGCMCINVKVSNGVSYGRNRIFAMSN